MSNTNHSRALAPHTALIVPGPRPLPLLGNVFGLARDPLAYPIECFERYGDTVALRIPGMKMLLTRDPRHIDEVLVQQSDAFVKYKLVRQLRDSVGDGLMVSQGETWRRARRIVSPSFRPQAMMSYQKAVVDLTREMLEHWTPGQTHDLIADSRRLGLSVITETLMGKNLGNESQCVAEFVEPYMDTCRGILGSGLRFPAWVPTWGNLRWRRALRRLDALLAKLIAARRQGELGDDLLSALLRARDDDGRSLSDRELRDEAITVLLSGRETTSLSVAFTLWLLARHPHIADQVRTELAGIDRSVAALGKLPLLDAVVKESVRLYPPSWHVGREALRDVQLGDLTVPRGTTVFISQWAMHRNPRYFDRPNAFEPTRWLEGLEDRLPKCAYLPFSLGPRVCVGKWMSLMVTKQVVAEVLQRFRLEALGPDPELVPSVTLRPKGPLPVWLEPL